MSLYASSNRAWALACTHKTNFCGDASRILWACRIASWDFLCHTRTNVRPPKRHTALNEILRGSYVVMCSEPRLYDNLQASRFALSKFNGDEFYALRSYATLLFAERLLQLLLLFRGSETPVVDNHFERIRRCDWSLWPAFVIFSSHRGLYMMATRNWCQQAPQLEASSWCSPPSRFSS
jgi:hypothetical protein